MGIISGHTLFLEAFRESVEKYSDKPAVWDEESFFTYKQLDKVTDIAAARALSLGAQRGDRIIVYVPRCKEVLTGAISAFKAGCVYVPADFTYPLERLNYMKNDSGAFCVFTTRKLWEKTPLEISSDRVIFLDEISPDEEVPEEVVFPAISRDDDAFVVYTSGSTGNPKGVLHDHGSLFYIANWHPLTERPVRPDDKYCHIAGFSFVAGMIDLFSPLMFGGSTVVFSDATRLDPARLYEELLKHKVTCVNTSMRYAVLLMENFDMRPFIVRLGGEKVTQFNPMYSTSVIEIYGSSEGSMIASASLRGNEDPMPLGKPCEGIEMMLIDEELNPVPEGEIGELSYSGPNVAKKYLNRPELNQEKWFEKDGKRWFRSGDLGRRDETGTFYYVQRKDFMIKLRGFRIEPGEIEKQVMALGKGKITGTVCVLKKVSGEDRLCCYFAAGEPIDTEALRAELSGVLAEYMIPDKFIQMDALPKNQNGKLDRNSLPQPVEDEEEMLTSLGIMRLAAEAYEKYGVKIEFDELAAAGNRNKIIELIESKVKAEEGQANKTELPEPEEAPLSFSQLGVYADCMANPKSLMYNLPVLFRMPEGVTEDILAKAVRDIIDAHPYVYVRFVKDNEGNTVQKKFLPAGEYKSKTVAITEKELQQHKNEIIKPFRLDGSEALFRTEIISTEEALYLFMDFHHLIFDGSSLYRFYVELNLLLSGESVKKENFSAMHLAAQQKQLRSSEKYNELHDFWRDRMSVLESASEIPADIFGKEGVGNEAAIVTSFNPEEIRDYAKKKGITPSSIYLAGLMYTISAYTGEDDAGIVTISNGRRSPEISGAFGMFVNTLPITAHIPDGNTEAFVKNIQSIFTEAIAHENYPFSDIAAEFGYRPNIMFAYQEDLLDDRNTETNKITFENLEQGTAKFPLYFSVTGHGSEISIELRYDENMYTRAFMEDMLKVYCNVIRQLCTCETLEEISFCNEEQLSLLDSFNPDIKWEQETETIVSMFRGAALAYPDNTAVVFKDKTLSYSELDDITDRLAAHIEKRISGKSEGSHEPVVSILVNRGLYMIIGALGALKAGCAYQPLDPGYPAERINYMISDAQPVLLMEEKGLSDIADSYQGDILYTEDIEGIIDAEQGLPTSVIDPENLFILLYTSGSTGKPKGVMLEHRNLTAFCRWYHRYYGLEPEHRVAGYASFGFDACMMDMYPALTRGASLHIIPEEMRLDLDAVNAYFNRNKISHSFMTSQVGVQFHLTQDNSSLIHFSVGGEKLVPVKPKDDYILHNGYGPTECTIFSTTMPVLAEEPNIPIGRPVDALKCRIVDKHMRTLPVGAIGELLLIGPQVGRGYLNLPEQTAKTFFTMDNMPAYHTGDMVRYRISGDIEFAGRKDGQVKVRGFRIELKEIEAIIRSCEGIKDVTVQAFDAPKGGKFLAAFIVCEKDFEVESLKAFILANKPSYMLPASIMVMDKIPLNVNQKVDKRALPIPKFLGAGAYVPPETEKERMVAEAVGRMLGIDDDVSVADEFTALGGDSINAIRLTTEMRDAGLEIEPGLILRLNTIREIAKAATYADASVSISQEAYEGFVDNTAIVQYFYNLNMPVPNHFNQAMFYKSAKAIDMKTLKESLDILVEHHDLLRAVSKDGRLYVRGVSQRELFTLEEARETDIDDRVPDIESSIDIEKGPLLKACVFHGTKNDYLLVVIHHLVVDGISWRIFAEDLNTVYAGLISGNGYKLPDKTHGYADYADSLKKYRESPALISQKPYWEKIREELGRYAMSEADSQNTVSPKFNRAYLEIDEELSDIVLTKCREAYNTGINDLLIAALGISYHRLTGEKGVSLRLEGHGREEFDSRLCIDRTIGWFTSIYPVVMEHIDCNIKTVIRETKERLHAVPKKGFGYGQLYGIETEHMPLITFNYLGQMAESSDDSMFVLTEDHSVGDMISRENNYGTDLNFNGLLSQGKLTFVVDYNSQRFSREKIDKLIGGYKVALKEIAEHILSVKAPEKTASDLGEQQWTDKEFKWIEKDFRERNEEILGIQPMSRRMQRIFRRALFETDMSAEMKSVLIQVDGKFIEEDFREALQEMYERHDELREAVAFFGVSVPRIVLTDRKAEITYIDLSDKDSTSEEMYAKLAGLDRLSIDMQMNPLMQLTVIKETEDYHFLVFSFHRILFDMPTARLRIKEYLYLLDKKSDMETNLSEWIKLLNAAGARKKQSASIQIQDVAPSRDMNENEKKIAVILEELLDSDADKISPESNFFDIGGDQFTCMELSQRILEKHNVRVPGARIYESPTIEGIAENMRNSMEAEFDNEVYFYSRGEEKTPLVFVHTANTGSEVYYRLAKYLEDEFAFSVMEQYNINHFESPVEDIPALAAKYVEILKRYQPHGPYNLGGWCFGGTVAYEMACQLREAGEKVEKLILMDSHIVESDELRQKLIKSSAAHSRETLETAPLFEGMRKKGLLEKLIINSSIATRAWLYYEPPEYDGEVLYFKASLKAEGLAAAAEEMYDYILGEKAAGYEKKIKADKLTVVDVLKDHDSLMDEDALETIVPALKEFLQ